MEEVLFDRYNAFSSGSGNVIWAAAMQLAWIVLRQTITHNNTLALLTQNPASLAVIDNFNNALFNKDSISPQSIYTKCGYGQETLDAINKEVEEKFPNITMPPLNIKMQKTDIISYAYLFKKITFETKFEKRPKKSFKFKNKAVESFYAKDLAHKKQVIVHQYANPNNFLVHIADKSQSDFLYLLKSEKKLTVDQVINLTIEASTSKGEPLTKTDYFEMPIIKLDEQRDYKELIGLQFSNPELKDYFIKIMKEKIKLTVDESGAKVENEAVIIATRSIPLKPVDAKEIILDSDFWIVMKEANKHPYLCVLIRNI